jgi:hypothetical protein
MTRKATIVLLLIALAFMGRIVVTSFVSTEEIVFSTIVSTDMEKEPLGEDDSGEDDKLSERSADELLNHGSSLKHFASGTCYFRELIREIHAPPPQA